MEYSTQRLDNFFEALYSVYMYNYETKTFEAREESALEYKDDFDGWINHLVDVYVDEFNHKGFEPIDKEALLKDIAEDEKFRADMKNELETLVAEAEEED